MSELNWLYAQYPVLSVKKLSGITGGSHLIVTSTHQLILRQQTDQVSRLGICYYNEARLLSKLKLSFSPKPYTFSRTFSLLHWIKGETVQSYTFSLLKQLAQLFAFLHQIPLQKVKALNLPRLDIYQRCHFLWQQLTPKQQNLVGKLSDIKPVKPFHLAICHHDVHLDNLVKRGNKLYLIDWEYAALSDSALEIAMFLHNNKLSVGQKNVFLRHYFHYANIDRLAFCRKVREYRKGIVRLNQLWCLVHSDINP